ncbi:magnesium-translocating P-type ATPase [Microbacterium sp. NPDC056052]|uniref:magnesium-translocating P-type ATPase n=1 Tax=Microbacterium sp. NPDC056052 TaxID=3345695 RepID=UPI0035DC7395
MSAEGTIGATKDGRIQPVGRAPGDGGALSAVRRCAAEDVTTVLSELGSGVHGLDPEEARARLERQGPNAIRGHRARPWRVLGRQVRSPIVLMLFATAVVAGFVGDATDAVVIGVILLISIGLGFVNEFRAERAADAMHDRLRHTAIVRRAGTLQRVDVTELVVGDVVALSVGAVIPADLRLLRAEGLECDESILTGEAHPASKGTATVPAGTGVGGLTSGALMGTVVHAGAGDGVVVATGAEAEFGRIAAGLAAQEPQTEFQRGLGRFSRFLLLVAIILTATIFVIAVLLGRPLIQSLLFSLAIAVGITPQLLPAVVSTSLAAGSRAMARRRVLVKRVVCIEDLGDLDLLVTDKTGTLTTGEIVFARGVPVAAGAPQRLVELGLIASGADLDEPSEVGLNAIDAALLDARAEEGAFAGWRRLDAIPFDHERRTTTVLAERDGRDRIIVLKGAAESVLPHCTGVPDTSIADLNGLYGEGFRVIAVASRGVPHAETLAPGLDEGLAFEGLLIFADGVKPGAQASLQRLADLGVAVKVCTGDSAVVAARTCGDLGLDVRAVLTGGDIDELDDAGLIVAAERSTVFARVSPEQKARIVRALRHSGRAVGFLGDGVNDALALHGADIGISVDSAVDVAKDAADVLLLDKDLDVLADGVAEGRRIFANTIKYVMMGTSSNFGNMFSASVASVILPFLPMLPGQILLNNLLYDASQLVIPADRVDPEQLRAPSHWDIAAVRRFMLLFGPISSLFDFATFGLMLFVFHAGAPEFRSGWFIESIATQTLIVFAIRTRRVPFTRSRPAPVLIITVLAAIAVGAWLPYSPANGLLGFTPLPAPFFLALVGMLIVYLVLVELAKLWYFRRMSARPVARPSRPAARRVLRRAARFTARSGRAGPARS